jgi:hypothetical protein
MCFSSSSSSSSVWAIRGRVDMGDAGYAFSSFFSV